MDFAIVEEVTLPMVLKHKRKGITLKQTQNL